MKKNILIIILQFYFCLQAGNQDISAEFEAMKIMFIYSLKLCSRYNLVHVMQKKRERKHIYDSIKGNDYMFTTY